MKVTIGGNRLGSGGKMEAEMHTYERSSHDLGYIWRSTMSAGTIVPFMVEILLNGDTADIELDAEVRTHPTVGPLWGSYKLQCDIFSAAIRLYNAQLHNNELGIGMKMQNVMFPQLQLTSYNPKPGPNSYQINPSCILAYLGIRGLGYATDSSTHVRRDFNAMPLLMYWDIFKNYYANKQEENAYVIHTILPDITSIDEVTNIQGNTVPQDAPDSNIFYTDQGLVINFNSSVEVSLNLANIIRLVTDDGTRYQPSAIWQSYEIIDSGGSTPSIQFSNPLIGGTYRYWSYMTKTEALTATPDLYSFPLSDIDAMRDKILQAPKNAPLYITEDIGLYPYSLLTTLIYEPYSQLVASQEGLAVKTYQSDLFNNWMQTEWIDGDNGISAITAVDTTSGSFTMDTLNMAQKVYNMLNRIALSGGSYFDWQETVYTERVVTMAYTPVYEGGLSKEVLFQEIVQMTPAQTDSGQTQLGQLGGKGIMGKKHKGGKVVIHAKEPIYIMGLVSLTPRIDYSQGNKWIGNLQTMDDLHKPALDEIGFQDLITDQMAYWDTEITSIDQLQYNSVGKQPAWINYMTNVNQTYGNFAIPDNEMFMTLNRRYEQNSDGNITDLTTYIDPAKFNFVFAYTSLDAQNFWVQIAVNITARRKMSAKIIPNL